MKPLRDRDIERLLTAGDDPRPPADLANRIKAEIPELLPDSDAAPPVRVDSSASRPSSFRRLLPLAAMLLVALGAAMIGLRLRDDIDPLAELRTDESQPAESTMSQGPADDQPSARLEDSVGEVAVQESRMPLPERENPPSAVEPIPGEPSTDNTVTLPPESSMLEERALTDPVAPIAIQGIETELQHFDRSERFRIRAAAGEDQTETIVFGIPDAPEAQNAPGDSDAVGLSESARGTASRQGGSSRIVPQTPVTYADPAPIPNPPPPPMRPAAPTTSTARSLEETRRVRRQPANELASKAVRSAPPDDRRRPPQAVPYDAVTFRDYGTNPWTDPQVDRLSTFGLDVDTGSFNIVRRFLEDGHLPDPAAVRVEELINAFDYRDRPPSRGDFAVHIEMAPSPFGASPSSYLVRFAVKAREVGTAERPPVDLVFVVDTSGSMAREDRLGLVQDAGSMLLDQLRPDDRVALVTFNDNAQIALLPTNDHAAVRRCLTGLTASGSTNAAQGLHLGYRLAADYRRAGASGRVILLSDGVANVGTTSAAGMLEEVADNRAAGVELTTVGVGMGNYNDVLLEQLADRGDGRYAYVDDRAEAHRLFVETLTGTLTTVAAEAKVQVEFDTESVARYRLLGYENRAIADRDFRNDRVDAGEIGAGHTVVALYEIDLHQELGRRQRGTDIATLHLRHRSMAEREIVEKAYRVPLARLARRFEDASPAFQLTALVAEAAEILRRSPHARGGSLVSVFRETQRLSAHFADDHRIADWVASLSTAARLTGGSQIYDD